MITYWLLQTHGDPLGTVQRLMQNIWQQANLKGLLAPINNHNEQLPTPKLLPEKRLVQEVNPFKPLMAVNAARMVPEVLQQHPQEPLGALLRPCELRALIEMVKHDGFSLDRLLTISVDCLSTVPVDEYRWRASRKQKAAGLADEALQFARQGGIAAYRYRSACQICASQQAHGAQINIHVLGLPVRQQILVHGGPDCPLDLATLTDGPAEAELVQQHEHLVAQLRERHQRTRERLWRSLSDQMPRDIQAVIDLLESCDACQQCLAVCPICAVDYPRRSGTPARFQPEDVMRWLVSCAECGMCDQACPRHLSLSAIFGFIRRQLADEYGYLAGRSLEDPLPVI